MNIEIANRLFELRKQKNMSQEELAERIGVSRQAVSKWERAESSPDTDNLIELARLYEVSLDELLFTTEPLRNEPDSADNKGSADNAGEKSCGAKSNCDRIFFGDGGLNVIGKCGDEVYIGVKGVHVTDIHGDEVHIGTDGIRINDSDDETFNITMDAAWEQNKSGRRGIWYRLPVPLIVATIYILIGIFAKVWHPTWLIVFAIPMYYECVAMCYAHSWRKKLHIFPIALISITVYIYIGFVHCLWHPGWLIFAAIPVYHQLVSMISAKRLKSKLNHFPMAVLCCTAYLYIGYVHHLWHPYWLLLIFIPLYHSTVSTMLR